MVDTDNKTVCKTCGEVIANSPANAIFTACVIYVECNSCAECK